MDNQRTSRHFDENLKVFLLSLKTAASMEKKYPKEVEMLYQQTAFLPEQAGYRQRIWHIINDIYSIPVCAACGTEVKWHHVKKSYNKFCSTKCANADPDKKNLIQQTIKQRYGVVSYAQKDMNEQTLISLSSKLWLIDQHVNQKLPLYQIAQNLNVDPTTLTNYMKRHKIDVCSYSHDSYHQREIANVISEITNSKILTNTKIIPPYEIDIFIPQHNLAIEYCGLFWHSDSHKRIDKNYHFKKYLKCKEQGIRLITIFEDEWLYKRDIVIATLRYILHSPLTNKIYARNTTIKQITTRQRREFLNHTHIQGDGRGSINLGIFNHEELIGVGTFFRQKDHTYVLNRYASSVQIVGGFSKLIQFFHQLTKCKTIITFADLRWSEGNLYQQTGFNADLLIPPDYFYLNQQKTKRIHKFNYRHKNLPRLLPKYDPQISEWENCKNNQVYRIWDCGKIRYVKTISIKHEELENSYT